jgi:ribosomal-protein-alanine N-acetyltransferase
MADPFEPVTLETERLRLRFMDERDTDTLFAICAQPAVMRYTPRAPMKERAEAVAMLARIVAGYRERSTLQLAIVRKSDGLLLGDCVLFRFHEESRRAEIGYKLDTRHWGRGYMHEALTAFIGHGFGTLGLNRIEADIDPRNGASARSLLRLGFTHEGLLRQRWIVNGEVSDTGMYGLLASDWAAARSEARTEAAWK